MITEEQAAMAMTVMCLCRFFPSEDFQRAQVITLLLDMVNTEAELNWLTTMQCKFDWKGPQELRGLFCSRFSPRDGVEADCSHAGFTSGELEMQYIAEQSALTDRRLLEWRREQKLLGDTPVEIDVTTALKQIAPSARKSRTEINVRAKNNEISLAATLGVAKPTYVRGTGKRTEAENLAIVRELEAQLAGGAK